MPMDTRTKRLIHQGVRKSQYRTVERAFLGEPIGPNQYTFTGLRPGRTRARLVRGHENTVVALIDVINHQVERNPAIRILIDKNVDGEWEVQGIDGTYAMQTGGSAAAFIGGAGPHTHRIGFGLEDMVEPRRFEPGLVYADEAFQVTINPFFYAYNGEEQYFAGGTLDLASYLPTTTNSWQWIKVGVDKATNTAVAAAGAEYASESDLTISDLLGIPWDTDYIQLAGVKVKASDTAIQEERRFQDLRQWLSGGGGIDISTIAVDRFGDVLTSANGEIVWVG